eukprot:3436780-Rhodomonas_salina.2
MSRRRRRSGHCACTLSRHAVRSADMNARRLNLHVGGTGSDARWLQLPAVDDRGLRPRGVVFAGADHPRRPHRPSHADA